jgi:hypothetical protein
MPAAAAPATTTADAAGSSSQQQQQGQFMLDLLEGQQGRGEEEQEGSNDGQEEGEQLGERQQLIEMLRVSSAVCSLRAVVCCGLRGLVIVGYCRYADPILLLPSSFWVIPGPLQ